jgi:hypothetical protein
MARLAAMAEVAGSSLVWLDYLEGRTRLKSPGGLNHTGITVLRCRDGDGVEWEVKPIPFHAIYPDGIAQPSPRSRRTMNAGRR